MKKILTCCKQGLVRSVALADVLKMHFRPVDVIPVGLQSNTQETLDMLYKWADWVIVMQTKYREKIPDKYQSKVLVCDVGDDIYGFSRQRHLIDQCWEWCRSIFENTEVEEHFDKL